MYPKQTWMRASAVVGGRRWHLLEMERSAPWCGIVLTALPTTVVQAGQRPGRRVCRECLRAEESAFRAEYKADKKARKQAAAQVRTKQRARPLIASR